MAVNLIVAQALNRVIGANNQLPWHLPEDLKHFRALTTGHAVVMGRKTFESIGRALPERRNVVITRQTGLDLQGAKLASSLVEAIQLCRHEQQLFIIGGAQIYQEALQRNLVERIYLTQINEAYAGDTFFPELHTADWQIVDSQANVAANGLRYTLLTLNKVQPLSQQLKRQQAAQKAVKMRQAKQAFWKLQCAFDWQ